MKTQLHINIMAMGLIFFLFAGINLTAQDSWVKYPDNPVFSGAAWSNNAWKPVVIFEDNVFKMWFGGTSANGEAIGYAESPDGINWDPNNDPVIPDGEPGDWDQWRGPASVLRVNDTLKMWYSGSSDNFNYEISIGYAWSLDNIVWNVLPDKVLDHGEPGTWEETGVIHPVVYYDGSTYHMWYCGFEGSTMWDPMQEGYATSLDGINWVKDVINNPVITLGAPGSFFDTWVIGSSVLFLEDTYHLWFAGWDGLSLNPWKYVTIGYATSLNGIDWTIQNDFLPVIDHGVPGEWDDRIARYSSVLIHDDQFKMWYDGRGSSTKIGYAEELETSLFSINSTGNSYLNVNPNPVKKDAIISFRISEKSHVKLEIFNHQGQQVATLVDGDILQGEQCVIFEGSALPSGIYFCVLKTPQTIETKKIIKLD